MRPLPRRSKNQPKPPKRNEEARQAKEAEEKQTQEHVLHFLKCSKDPVSPEYLRKSLVKFGYNEGAVRTAIARLWDKGCLNVDVNRNLMFVKDKK